MAGVLAVGALTVPVPPAALACSVTAPGPTEEELLAMADVVFEGVVGTHRDPAAGATVIGSGDPSSGRSRSTG